MHRPIGFWLVLVAAIAAGCGGDVVSHSGPVGIHLAFSSGDVAAGRVGDDKNINTESGNPYAAYIAEAQGVLGHDPSRIEVDSLTLTVTPGSSGVTQLGAIFDGVTAITFEMNGTDTIVPVATLAVDAAVGAGPAPMSVGFDSDTVTGEDWTSLVDGNFKVIVDGPAAAGFAGASASVDLEALFTFEAIE
jgi:hypothetical protein